MTKEKLREALDNFVQGFGLTDRTGTLTANDVLAYAAGYGFDMPFAKAYDVVMKIVNDYDLKWGYKYDQF